jgi:excisionase family DNA binding protein
MSLRSKEHRAASWDQLATAQGADRDLWFNVIAGLLREDVGPCVDFYSPDYDELFVRALRVLDAADLLPQLRDPYLAVDGTDDAAPEEFVAHLIGSLADASDTDDDAIAAEAGELFRTWRTHLLHRTARDEEFLSVAEVASIYQVTPQAVYKWIRSGKVPAEATPGGGRHRIRRSALQTTREQEVRIDALQQRLHERAAELGTASMTDAEIVELARKARK